MRDAHHPSLTARHDPVTRPSHYTQAAVECIDAIHAALGDEAFVAYCRGNALKYAWRAGRKDALAQDLRKGAWYLTRAAQVLEATPAATPAATAAATPVIAWEGL